MTRHRPSGNAATAWGALLVLAAGLASSGAQTIREGDKGAASGQGSLGLPRLHTIEGDSEAIWSSAVVLTETWLRYNQQAGDTELDAAVNYASFDEDYRPFAPIDFFGFPEHVHEDRYGLRLDLRRRVAEPWTLVASGGAYAGYLNYRRVWIANRYRQKYDHPDFPRIPGYEEPDPKGYHFSTGARWEYLPAIGFAEIKAGYAFDQIPRGYVDHVDNNGIYTLLRGRERLDSTTVGFSSENILLKHLRAMNEFTATKTTERDWRFSYQGSLNVALGDRWVMRGYGGITTEAPQFDAHFFGLTLECEVIPSVLLSLTGRYYEDTGEIESSLPITSAAPPLTSWELGLGLRYAWTRSSLKIYVGPFWTDYHPRPGIAEEFTFLYTDRNWGLAQIAYSVQF